jgi:hypothetical protein
MTKEKIKDILKPIRQKAQESEGIDKMIYDEILRKLEITLKGKKEVTRQEVWGDLERQRSENRVRMEDDKRMIQALDKGDGYIHWDDGSWEEIKDGKRSKIEKEDEIK